MDKSIKSKNTEPEHYMFKLNTNTIHFTNDGQDYYNNSSCTVNINVDIKSMKIGKKIDYYYFDITFSHTTEGTYGDHLHPLYWFVHSDSNRFHNDLSLYDGIIVAANPITFHMLQVLLSNDKDSKHFNTGSRPFKDYQAETMRALTEFEN